MKTLDDGEGDPYGCAVDPKTGNLAVSNFCTNYLGGTCIGSGNIAVYLQAPGHGDELSRFADGLLCLLCVRQIEQPICCRLRPLKPVQSCRTAERERNVCQHSCARWPKLAAGYSGTEKIW